MGRGNAATARARVKAGGVFAACPFPADKIPLQGGHTKGSQGRGGRNGFIDV
jgi:hypothetical protein